MCEILESSVYHDTEAKSKIKKKKLKTCITDSVVSDK